VCIVRAFGFACAASCYARAMRWLALWFLVACENTTPPPAPAPPSVAPRDALKRIEDLPKLADYRDPNSPYDCTVISAMKGYFAGERVESCGMLELHATPESLAAATACMEQALAATRPVIFAQAVQGTDSGIAVANLARMEHARYTGYVAHFDSDPCGGGCQDRGWTRIVRCTGAPRVSTDCPDRRGACLLDCDGPIVESCRNGKATAVSRADAEKARAKLFGPTPASLGPAFGPLQLGVPFTDWKAPPVTAAIQAIEAGGIVALASDRSPYGATIDSIALDFAGPCTAIRAEIVARWGATADDLWVDASAHRRARFNIEACQLRIDRFLDVDAWLADTAIAPFPLGAIGTSAAALAKRVGATIEDGSQLRWSVPGIGRATGTVEIDADVQHGRIVGLDAHGDADGATLGLLRARLTALRGKPIKDDVWRGKISIGSGRGYRDGDDKDGFSLAVGTSSAE
jgi:hypothetical protein